jgi:hypothetical protein
MSKQFDDVYLLQELGLIRKPASFMTSICDERGQELNYAGMPISDVSYLSFEICNNISVHMHTLSIILSA